MVTVCGAPVARACFFRWCAWLFTSWWRSGTSLQARKQFNRGVERLAARLAHPLVMPIEAYFYDAETKCFCVQMPWFGSDVGPGAEPVPSTLDRYCVAQSPTDPATVVRKLELIAKVLQALDHVHGREVIHCDIKPENVLVVGAAVPLSLLQP